MPRVALLLFVVGLTCLPAVRTATAQSVLDARRQVEIARLRLRLYEQVEHPAAVRRLKSEYAAAEAEVASLKRLLKEYEPFDRFSTGRPLVFTIESTKLSLLRAELRRDDLREELNAQTRWHGDRLRLYRLELEQARAGL